MKSQHKQQQRRVVEELIDRHDGLRTPKHRPQKRTDGKRQVRDELRRMGF